VSFSRAVRVAVVCCWLCSLASPAVAAPSAFGGDAAATGPVGEPAILGAYPNPATADDAGEFVVVRTGGVANLTLSDGESTAPVPSAPGVVALSSAPARARALAEGGAFPETPARTDRPVARAELRLANAGERLVLRRDGVVVDEATYGTAPEAERWNATTGRWVPRGLTLRPAVSAGPANATVFVLPDDPSVVRETLRSADERVLLAGYTFASSAVAETLLDAHRRGVRVRVLLEGSPVGGVSTRQAAVLARLTRGGVPVRVVSGPLARFDYHHAKYAVVDDAALVLTENWKPTGTGGRWNRGWGVRVADARAAAELAEVFSRDFGGEDAVPWRRFRRGREFTDASAGGGPERGDFPRRIAAESVEVREVRVLTAPGNAGAAIVDRIDGAERSVDVLVPRIDPHDRFFEALVRAARRGVRVRILLSNAWYDEAENRVIVNRTRALRERGYDIEARIARPRGRFGKVHAKGAVVDGERAFVGSLNWNDHSATENREVVLELVGEEPAAYYAAAFEADWRAAAGSGERGSSTKTTVTLALGACCSLALATWVLRRTVRFDA
jgi:phosphatidylserine/phosphatidylglycerophosphate/cardiolipin synthase-like enzyme